MAHKKDPFKNSGSKVSDGWNTQLDKMLLSAFLVGYLAKMSERMHLLMMELITGKRHLASFKNMKQHSHIRTVWFVGTATKQACQKGML